MIKVGHKSIADTLLKMTQEGIIIEINDWVTHFPTILLVNKTIIKVSMKIIPFRMLYGEKAMLFIKLNVLTW